MCEPVTLSATTAAWIAGAGLAASVAGTGVSYMASQNAANAASRAAQETQASQAAGFASRNQAQRIQTQEQAAAQDRSQQTYAAAQGRMRAEQDAAQTERANVVNKINTQTQAVSDQSQQAVKDMTAQVTPQSLADAMTGSQQARMAGVDQAVPNIQASNPLATSGGGGGEARAAMAKSMEDAAAYTEKYGQNLARLGSYGAPVTTVESARRGLGYSLMPIAAQDQLLKGGAGALLLPSQTAYGGATTLGRAALDANTMRTNEEMGLTRMRQTQNEDLANLTQNNTNANIQTGLNLTQARDATLKGLGNGISSIGNAAINFGASKGAFSDLFGSGTPAAKPTLKSDASNPATYG